MSAALDADVAVVGSGFAGSLCALALRRRGKRVVLIERGRHPRFAIGESTTPLTNLLLKELCDRYDLPRVRAFTKWGRWQRERPEVSCGLKRGFTFAFHELGRPFAEDERHARSLLVAASADDESSDTHWYRPDFDLALVGEAQEAGAIYLDETRVEGVRFEEGHARLDLARSGRTFSVRAGFVVDASGPRGFLASTLGLAVPSLRWLPPTQGLYTHFAGAGLWRDVAPAAETPPYPPDDAALHHVFPGGWIWILRFENGLTSAGAALTDELASSLDAAEGAAAWTRLLERLPSIREQFAEARATLPFIHAPRVAFRVHRAVGDGWALLPSAAGVIDPLLSTGFSLTLLGLLRLLDVLEHTSPGAERRAALDAYERSTQSELDATEQLVGALYATMGDPELFKRVSLLYFAAASYTEAVRRLGLAREAPGFLLEEHPVFGTELRACTAAAATSPRGERRAALIERIGRAIEPFDVAGLLDRSRRDWYPVLASDLVAGAHKLGVPRADVERWLERSAAGP